VPQPVKGYRSVDYTEDEEVEQPQIVHTHQATTFDIGTKTQTAVQQGMQDYQNIYLAPGIANQAKHYGQDGEGKE
jgi:hypothetical protein